MLRAVTSDFKVAGHSVVTVLDSRLAAFNPPLEADCVLPVTSFREAESVVQETARSADAVYVIAPETNGVLESLVRMMEGVGVPSLNCSGDAVKTVSDKSVFLECVKKMGVATPESTSISVHDGVEGIAREVEAGLGFPAVFKPVDGVGCSGLSVVEDRSQIKRAVTRVREASSSEVFLIQQLVPGEPVSVSVFSTGTQALPVSLNKQNISLKTPESFSSFDGGVVPFDNPMKRKVFSAAKKIVESVRGLKGYVGVDMVLTEEEPVFLELNPRLTTSYVGLRLVAGFNPAHALMDSASGGSLPADCESYGYACFAKVKTPKPSREALLGTYWVDGVFSPPFPIGSERSAFALLVSRGAALNEAYSRLERSKTRLLSMLKAGGE
jgi:predicted ATP-grasp superfamily ATP-dependent carboligase